VQQFSLLLSMLFNVSDNHVSMSLLMLLALLNEDWPCLQRYVWFYCYLILQRINCITLCD